MSEPPEPNFRSFYVASAFISQSFTAYSTLLYTVMVQQTWYYKYHCMLYALRNDGQEEVLLEETGR